MEYGPEHLGCLQKNNTGEMWHNETPEVSTKFVAPPIFFAGVQSSINWWLFLNSNCAEIVIFNMRFSQQSIHNRHSLKLMAKVKIDAWKTIQLPSWGVGLFSGANWLVLGNFISMVHDVFL